MRISDWSSDVCSSDLALQYMARDLADDLAVIDDQTGFRHIVPPTPPGFASSYGKGVCSPLISDKIHAALATGRVTNCAGSTTSSDAPRCSIIASATRAQPGDRRPAIRVSGVAMKQKASITSASSA